MREREILLVEDNDNDIILTKRALTKANIKNELVMLGMVLSYRLSL